jgi:acyl carrier protein
MGVKFAPDISILIDSSKLKRIIYGRNDCPTRHQRCFRDFQATQTCNPPGEPLISSGLIDSFSLIDLSLFVKKDFGVRIEDTELNAESFDTLQELIKLIQGRQ